MWPLLARLEDVHGENLRIVFRHFPLMSIHDKALVSAEAAEAAGAQGAFWEMHDLLFERQAEWAMAPLDQVTGILAGYAEKLGLDREQFAQDLADGTYRPKVEQAYQQASQLGLRGTPTFIINGIPYQWGLSYAGVDAFIRLIQLIPDMYTEPPPQVIDPGREYLATIKTERGDIVVELYADLVPTNVNNFVFLAQEGWYDSTTFHRVVPGFVAQGGDPTHTGVGYPGYRCGDEIVPELAYDGPGVVGMASGGPGTNSIGSQFFITYDALPDLTGNYTIIGRVIEGMEVVESLTPRDPIQDPEAPPGDVIETITIEER